MDIKAVVISNDKVFARMLTIEMLELGIETEICENLTDELCGCGYSIVLADLDFCGYGALCRFLSEKDSDNNGNNNELKPDSNKMFVIGWTCLSDASSITDANRCSVVLYRPFLMSEFRSLIYDNAFLKSRCNITDKILNVKASLNNASNKNRQYSSGRKIAGFHRNGQLTVDSENKSAVYGNEKISLSENEFKILDVLCRKRGETVTRKEISELLEAGQGNMGDVYICFLRKKIEGKLGLKLIYTVRGEGYMLKE